MLTCSLPLVFLVSVFCLFFVFPLCSLASCLGRLELIGPPPLLLLLPLIVRGSLVRKTRVKSWIQGEEYTITPMVVAFAHGVPMVQHHVYPYDESPSLDDIMSYLTTTSIQWGSDPRITSHELTEIHYLFFQISCHSIWPISHLHTILWRDVHFCMLLS